MIFNDDELMTSHGFERAEPEMTVDSEAIFALADSSGGRAEALEELCGSMATAWLDERRPRTTFLARGVGRPSGGWDGLRGTTSLLPRPLSKLFERFLRLKLRKQELAEGTLASRSRGQGEVIERQRFKLDRDFEERAFSPVRGPRRRRVLPRAACRSCGALCLAVFRLMVPSAATAVPDAARRSRIRNWKVEPGRPSPLEHAVDLPLRDHRVILTAGFGPVGELRQAPKLARQLDSLLQRPLELLLPHGHVEAGLRSALVSEPNVCQ